MNAFHPEFIEVFGLSDIFLLFELDILVRMSNKYNIRVRMSAPQANVITMDGSGKQPEW
jgi:hypothetical protein